MIIQVDIVDLFLLFGIGMCVGGAGVAWLLKKALYRFDLVVKSREARKDDPPLSIVIPFPKRGA